MNNIFDSASRRSVLKLLLALPLIHLLQRFFSPRRAESAAESAAFLKVAKVSELGQPWSSAQFTFVTSIKSKDVYGKEAVHTEHIPGVVIRLPDDLAQNRGGGAKDRFYVVNLHCTHERCATAYITDKDEIRAVSTLDAPNPVAYCPCHRSVFDLAADGKPIKGPAKEPLWKFNFDIKGDDIIVTGRNPEASIWTPGRVGGLTSEYPVRPGEPGL